MKTLDLMSDMIRKSQRASPRAATASSGSLLVPGMGQRDSTTWNAVAFQQQLMESLSLSKPMTSGAGMRGNHGKRRIKVARKPEVPTKLSFLVSEKQQKPRNKHDRELESEEYVLGMARD